jgi:hypothetical protein
LSSLIPIDQRLTPPVAKRRLSVLFEAAAVVGACLTTWAAVPEQPPRHPGGYFPYPFITGVQARDGWITVDWDGFGGPFRLQMNTDPGQTNWQTAGSVTTARTKTIPLQGSNAIFRVQAPPPVFAGVTVCASCHQPTYREWSGTPHAGAFQKLRSYGAETDPMCLPCHTVGFGVSTGYTNTTRTSHLTGVQCENCHGPAQLHSVYFDDPQARARVRVSGELCGGCHNDFHYPTYDEWKGSGHGKVTAGVAQSILASGADAMKTCGPCHSGAARLALLNARELPDPETAAREPVTCAVCHDPHKETSSGAQLRNPMTSTALFSYSMSQSFSSQYRSSVGVCVQCHNVRGAAWQDTKTAPHPSGQHNMLLGNVGLLSGPAEQAEHAKIPQQCLKCHTQVYPSEDPNESEVGTADHSFAAQPAHCAPCHSEASAVALISVTQADLRQRVGIVKERLDFWALTKAPPALREKYGSLAWEYSQPGSLSNPDDSPDRRGPTTAEQAGVPDAIKQARFNLYLVVQDGSFGVHNGKFSRQLLQVAEEKLNSELVKP